MAYADYNAPTKKALKDAIARGRRVRVFSPGPFPCPQNGRVALEGPHFPKPHRWYATAEVHDGVIVSIK